MDMPDEEGDGSEDFGDNAMDASALRHGEPPEQAWLDNPNRYTADLVAAGDFSMAQETLHRQFGIVNFEPLRPIFMKIYFASFAQHPAVSPVGHLRCPLTRDQSDNNDRFRLPDL